MEHNFCPSCGKQNFKPVDSKQYRCGDCDYTFFQNTAGTVGGIIRCGDHILLAVRGRNPSIGMLDLPGGFVDPDESFEAALAREIEEELQLKYDQANYLYSAHNTYLYKNVEYKTVDAIFEIPFEQRPDVTPGDDVSEICWLKPEEIDLNDIAFDSIRWAITRYRK